MAGDSSGEGRRPRPHPWRLSRAEAAEVQRRLARQVVLAPLAAVGPRGPVVAAGLDAAYSRDGTRAWAAAVAMDRGFRVLDLSIATGEPDSPYAPGYLAFREGRLLLEALGGLAVAPELVFVDGHGVVHERGFGIASHIGLLAGLPAIGVAKTPFHAIDRSPGPERGDACVLSKEWGAQGAAVRLKDGSKQVYVSPGHLVDLPSAIELALAWSTGARRVPEPLAAAHTASVLARSAAEGVAEAAALLDRLTAGVMP